MASSRHRNVLAYEFAAQIADELYDAISNWGKRDQWTIGVQLVRSSGSIVANIAEGIGRGSQADTRRLLGIARGSLLETEHWVDRARHAELQLPEDLDSRLSRIARLLHGLIQSGRLHR